tara:strand:- start:1184 stop:1459 length:276 start_codon:yes stop_codon:yes gene_type:complete
MKAPVIEDYSKLSKRELELLARKYGVELDRRLRKETLVRLVEIAMEKHDEEQDLLNDESQIFFSRGIFVGVVLGAIAGALCMYAFYERGLL